MKRAYLKDIVREIKRTRKRYISIIAIVILGVAFYVGINTGSPDMLDTYNKYMNDYNMFDLNLISTVGFNDDDLDTIKSIEKIDYIEPLKSVCAVTKKDDKEKVINVMSVAKNVTDETINKVELVEGNYPKEINQVVLDNKLSGEYKIGDTLEFINADNDLNSTFNITKYEVVGFANSPLYIALTRGNTNLGDGTISGFAVVLEDAFSMKEYTNVYARVTTENRNRTSAEYIEEIEKMQEQIEEETNKLADDKYSKLYEEAKMKYANRDFIDIESSLKDLNVKIYVLNLETNEGYVSYKSDCESVEVIGKVFPIIFFLVAALVSLTAMTRMVEENRGNIGTYKSLGYSRIKIASKYLIYSTSATLMGIILGVIIGSYTLPWVIAEAYGILYHTMPSVLMSINIEYSLTAGIAAFASTTIATIFACYKILRDTPAKLMRPKSPKAGKKIFLEKIPFIWKHFSFTKKITARNVFRYKKRLFMTIIGIAGCTALIFTGFGLRSSISSIVSKQYGEIRKYNFEVTLKDELNEEQILELNNYIDNNGNSVKYTYLRQQTNDIEANGKKLNVYIVGVTNEEELKDFVTIRNRKTKEEVNLKDDGVIITEKISKLMNVDIGDEIKIKIDDEKDKNVKVTGIVENYVYHYIYMNKDIYEETFEEQLIDNHIYISNNQELNEEAEEQISKYLLANDNISQVLRVSSISSGFEDMIKSLNMVVIVLITCAAMLAFVVLYNLNSINIEERKRELATIKLLGFYNKELSSYVFRENIVLTIIGAILGLILGVYLHFFVISTAEVDMVMFGRETTISSYILAFLLTIIFATLINLLMNKELKKIDMIESLKSVE